MPTVRVAKQQACWVIPRRSSNAASSHPAEWSDDGVCAIGLGERSAPAERLESGELGLDFYGLRGRLVDLGVEWIERADSEIE